MSNYKKATQKDYNNETAKKCEHCGKFYPYNKFINGEGMIISWCPACGENMLKALQMF